ncbi:PREDICTED: MEF2-activating motif and SAP domain-containing transcriptional regulator-like [Ipomoea nil]|uniref:MEF2-activating motif and SAP domain-containing transcriptional regulator-like n=1 Tax=Ipomoea nil TaxID=35883 RepID=UPI000901491C|nr:PREDICTED: MEF2-activating motif and SAP domain-containing transcriptional regulator-like [Ipomoea nil]
MADRAEKMRRRLTQHSSGAQAASSSLPSPASRATPPPPWNVVELSPSPVASPSKLLPLVPTESQKPHLPARDEEADAGAKVYVADPQQSPASIRGGSSRRTCYLHQGEGGPHSRTLESHPPIEEERDKAIAAAATAVAFEADVKSAVEGWGFTPVLDLLPAPEAAVATTDPSPAALPVADPIVPAEPLPSAEDPSPTPPAGTSVEEQVEEVNADVPSLVA